MAFLNPSLTLPQFNSTKPASTSTAPRPASSSGGVTPRQIVGLDPIALTPLTQMAPAPTTSIASTWSGSGSDGGSSAYVAPDPYAAWGGRTAYNNMVSNFQNQQNNIYGSASAAADNTGISIRGSVADLLDSIRMGQSAIDNRATNNELAKIRGTADVYSGIQRGINSGGVTLANKNASDSSARERIANAYGSIGQRQLSSIGNQYELENGEIAMAQTNLDTQEIAGARRINDSKEQAVNSIVTEATDKLTALDAQIAGANLPQRIAIDQAKQRVRADVVGRLAQYDAQLTQGRANIRPMDSNERMAEANRRNAAGAANPKQFQYETGAPAQFQNTGPYASTLPIFNYRKPE